MSAVTRKTKTQRVYIHPDPIAQDLTEDELRIIEATNKNVNDGVVRMLSEEPFWCDLLRNLDKGPIRGIDTTCVWVSKDLRLNWGWHPLFFGPYINMDGNFSKFEGIVIHELSHIAMGHITHRGDGMKSATPLMRHLMNIAMDLSINSTSVVGGKKGMSRMPDFGFYPGRPLNPINPRLLENLKPEQVNQVVGEHEAMSALIASLPEKLSYEMYLDLLMQSDHVKDLLQKDQERREKRLKDLRKKIEQMKSQEGSEEQDKQDSGDLEQNPMSAPGEGESSGEEDSGDDNSRPGGNSPGKGKNKSDGGTGESSDSSGQEEGHGDENGSEGSSDLDDLMEIMGHGGHDWHEGLTDDEKQYIEEKIRDAVRRAYNRANNTQMWGSVPQQIRDAIKTNLEGEVRWQDLLKRFVGHTNRADRMTTITRINKKYPGIHPGTTRDYKPRIHIYMDQSGSVGDSWIIKFFAELSSLARHVDFQLFYFDTEVDEENSIAWKKGTVPEMLRTRCGGTDFDAPTRHANSSDCDAYIILTDGGAPKPQKGKKRRAWILAPETELYFKDVDNSDVVIKMKGIRKTSGKAA